MPGPRGTGKTTTARVLAKSLNCMDRGADGEPCNKCSSCVGITEGSSLDVIELDAASHNKVEDIREIRVNVGTVASVSGARRVYILDEAHMLSRAASNALLKTLEEPPEHVHFVLATTEPYKLLDTVRSRSQRFDFHPIGVETLGDYLGTIAEREGFTAAQEGLTAIAHHARGSVRDGMGLLEQVAALGSGSVDSDGVSAALGLVGAEAFERLSQRHRPARTPGPASNWSPTSPPGDPICVASSPTPSATTGASFWPTTPQTSKRSLTNQPTASRGGGPPPASCRPPT